MELQWFSECRDDLQASCVDNEVRNGPEDSSEEEMEYVVVEAVNDDKIHEVEKGFTFLANDNRRFGGS